MGKLRNKKVKLHARLPAGRQGRAGYPADLPGVAQRRNTPIFQRKRIGSLGLAYQLTQRASKVGFDWPDIRGVLKKLDEELTEFREALGHRDPKRAQEELGDLLFVLANVARFLQINPEQALRKTIQKFISRFQYVEVSLKKKGKSLKQSNLIEMDRLWEEAKQKKRKRKRPK